VGLWLLLLTCFAVFLNFAKRFQINIVKFKKQINHNTILHNPRCAKSRAGLKYLQDKGVEPEIIKYLDNTIFRSYGTFFSYPIWQGANALLL